MPPQRGDEHQSPHTAGSPEQRVRAREAGKAAGRGPGIPQKPRLARPLPHETPRLPCRQTLGLALLTKGQRGWSVCLGPLPTREPQREPQSALPVPQIPIPGSPQVPAAGAREQATVCFSQKDTRVPPGRLSSEPLQGRHPWSQDDGSLLSDGACEHCPRGQESQLRARPSKHSRFVHRFPEESPVLGTPGRALPRQQAGGDPKTETTEREVLADSMNCETIRVFISPPRSHHLNTIKFKNSGRKCGWSIW